MTDYARRRTMMVDTQVRPADVTKFPIIEAMLSVPREDFVPDSMREAAYIGENLDIGPGRAILEPRTLAKMLDAVAVQPDELALNIGAAYGYSAAVLSQLAEAVVAVEEDPEMSREAESALAEYGADNVAVVEAPLTEGAPKHGPYDVIVIEGAVEDLPQALTDQLADGGRIVALFMEGALGVCRVGYKVDGALSWRFEFNAGAPVLPGFAKETAFQF
ncbi:protein-L-isoaspartate O-methyltransferase family protein [Tranquillimonas alkanivorans]|uniref:Protein-L-isoaspartate O-methyltransferase n=1 Tax=Tranquillimonas alkanivorans TaxID=441119 RepID=A0A1I5M1G1_9RHOB|nr:protein-L-isoaspartate O-methyltransferase [Tranquillimonas alkanivorans]SFP03283.1 protein-L-isoaspartate(D-aspartate) O-methyltransferase [Tranquillimonas alkanivorans]